MSPEDIPDIQMGWQPTTMVEVPPEMVFSIAMGLEEPDAIAARHGIEAETWEKLKNWKPFQQAVAAQRAEFEKNGVTFRLKQALKADILADKVFEDAMGPDATMLQRLEVLKTFAKLGNLEPKEDKSTQNGTTFSISIDLGDQSVRIAGGSENLQIPVEKPRKLPAEDVVDVVSRAFNVSE